MTSGKVNQRLSVALAYVVVHGEQFDITAVLICMAIIVEFAL